MLKEMFDTGKSLGQAGESIPMHSNISRPYAEALYQTILRYRPKVVLEVGMAFGGSSLSILSALRQLGEGGKLISIDPNQTSYGNRSGITAVERAGYLDSHQLIEDFDYNALPRLFGSGLRIDFAYIDGWHTFDYTLIDWWYADKMLNVGGIVAFNDCSMPAVDKVLRFVMTHRKYDELDVGLPLEVMNYSRLKGLIRRLTGQDKRRYYLQRQDRYFKKTQEWEPNWDFYAPF